MRASSDDRLESTAIRYLARRDRTEAQVRALLTRHGGSPTRIQAVIRRLQASGYLDDQAFAERWARARVAQKPMGRLRLEQELRAKGLTRTIIERVLAAIFADQAESDLARHLLRRRADLRDAGPHRQAGLLRRYGFSEETIELVVDSGQVV